MTVLQPGLFTTIQDLGRPGHRAAGVPLSGGVDAVSLRLANLLVGNPEGAAAIECTLVGPSLRFDHEAVVAMVGGAFPGLPGGVAMRIPAGGEVHLGHAATGCRGYLAVAGGIAVPEVLGSRSTLVAAGLGGLAGRPLRAGDRLMTGQASGAGGGRLAGQGIAGRRADLPTRSARSAGPAVLRIIPDLGAERHAVSAWRRAFTVSSRSDRMGLRLDGEPLPGATGGGGMASVAVFPGTVQLPPAGLPIVLLADAQTIGGYPILGQVISADLPRAAQLRPAAAVRLEPVSPAEARAALVEQEARIAAVREAMR